MVKLAKAKIFDKFNYVRDGDFLAHENELIDQTETRFIDDVISAFLSCIRAIEAEKFDA